MTHALTSAELALALSRIPPPKRKRPPLTPGRIVYLLVHYPRQVFRDGFDWHWHLWHGRRDLAAALATLTPPPAPLGEPIALHYLTGKRYFPLTTIALLSAQNHLGRPIRPMLYDDGSLDDETVAAFRRFFPLTRVFLKEELAAALDRTLPEARFPFLRRIRLGYIHLRKLTDVGVTSPSWNVVSDSDVFIFRRPDALLAAADSRHACHMVDCMTSYGTPTPFLDELAGTPLHPRVNVGLCHFDAAAIDWDYVEHCAAAILGRHGFSYYLEQALTAILLARAGAEPLDPENYLVYPKPEQARAPSQIALHYVDRSYLSLYRHGWRRVLADLAP
jgi:hypothetical protein